MIEAESNLSETVDGVDLLDRICDFDPYRFILFVHACLVKPMEIVHNSIHYDL